jgi:hypothetical protein
MGVGTIIEGTITSDFGVAAKHFDSTWQEIVAQIPEIQSSHPGTINVALSMPVLVINFDAVVNFSNGDSFGFVRVHFEFPVNASPVKAWLCLPHTSFNRLNMCRAEVITKKLDGIVRGLPCKVHYPRFTGLLV